MDITTSAMRRILWAAGTTAVGLCLLATAACSGPRSVSSTRLRPETLPNLHDATFGPTPAPKTTPTPPWQPRQFPPVKAAVPTIPNAQALNDNELCSTCHEAYVKHHKTNIHGQQNCEACHGPGSEHVRTRGQQPGLILSFKKMSPAEGAEACLKCHEQDACTPGQKWRTSAHAHANVSCTECHKGHYNVPPGTPATQVGAAGAPNPVRPAGLQESKSAPAEMAALKAASKAMGAANPDTCTRCHQQKADMLRPGHAHQIGGPHAFRCETCHDPHGNVKPEMRTDQCLNCHKSHPQWQGSKHAAAGVACADCHNPHSSAPSAGAADPKTCYKCHQQYGELQQVSGHPHQVCGAVGMRCATCHDPHGNIRPETRTDLCLSCHKGSPTMAWHSATHARYGVACADCHNPHPVSRVSPFVDIRHATVNRPKRLPMQVDQPGACFKCHPKTATQFSLPSHHPLFEGKITCSDCHDSHGQNEKNLREPTVNLTCYRCHADKQGPFVWQHPPVEENCGYCHNPHGTVTNKLLHQPTTFLCLRCHSGHREFRRDPDRNRQFRQPFFADCTICHAQVHGSDKPAATLTPRLTR